MEFGLGARVVVVAVLVCGSSGFVSIVFSGLISGEREAH